MVGGSEPWRRSTPVHDTPYRRSHTKPRARHHSHAIAHLAGRDQVRHLPEEVPGGSGGVHVAHARDLADGVLADVPGLSHGRVHLQGGGGGMGAFALSCCDAIPRHTFYTHHFSHLSHHPNSRALSPTPPSPSPTSHARDISPRSTRFLLVTCCLSNLA